MAHGRPSYDGKRNEQDWDHADSLADRSSFLLSSPVQSTDDTGPQFTENGILSSLDSGLSSMRLSSVGSYPSSATVFVDPENTYRMDYAKRGYCLIINNRSFHRNTKVPDRIGSDLDAANMYTTFKKLDFDVDLQPNKTCDEMLRLIINYSAKDHKDCDCFVLSILSHGDEGEVYGTDGSISLKQLVAPLKVCKSLVGKPKLLFIQACQGSELSQGVDVTDAEVFVDKPATRMYRIPQEADFLFAYSTTPGTFAFRNSNKGSWFIQAVSKVFQSEQATQLEITRLLTRVNRIVAEDYESKAQDPAFCGKKQMPCIVSMLRKDLYFAKK